MNEIEKMLWVEKYRPKTIDDCILPEQMKETFKGFIKNGMPNLILAGSAGIGKTTVARAICNELGITDTDMLFINASSERNIDVLRTTIQRFVSTLSFDGKTKVVILDEADGLNPLSTQPALRAFIEEFHKNCRFILTCNYPAKLIPALHSRCAVFDFSVKGDSKKTLLGAFYKRMLDILRLENIEFDPKKVQELIVRFFPDFRRTINELQRIVSVNGKIDENAQTSLDALEIDVFVKALKEKNFREAKKWIVETLSTVDDSVIFRKIYDSLEMYLKKESVPQAILLIANYQWKASAVADKEINMSAFAIECMSDLEFV